MIDFDEAAVSAPGEGRGVSAFGRNVIRITAAETGGRLGVLEITLSAGEGTPLHVHEREDEFFRVLSGRFGFWYGAEVVELGEGGCIALPRGKAHRLENIGDSDGRILVVVTPGGFEGFFAAVEARRPSGPDEIASIAAEYGVSFPTAAP